MLWLNVPLFVLLVAGHCQLWVSVINGLHSLPYESELLRRLRHVHDLLIIGFPVALVWALGIHGPAFLTDAPTTSAATWLSLPLGWTLYLSVCLAGAAGLIIGSLRHHFKRIPQLQVSNHSWTIDVEERLGFRPIGEGPFQFLTRVPGNELCQIEVSEKIYRLPRLPQEWDGLSILHLTDTHFFGTLDRPFFEQVAELSAELDADMLVFTGDLIDDVKYLDWLPSTLGRLDAPMGRYFILGNHDWVRGERPIREAMVDIGWHDVGSKTTSLKHKGHDLVIGGSERPWMGEHPNFSSAPADAFRLFLSHTPDNIGWAKKQNIDLMLSGHNHGGQVVLPIVGPVYSPSRYGCRYAGGVFWEDPTLLYVSRGLSGRHPLRWNCKPEVTKLVLRTK